jgi:hypothetical protein
VSPDSSAAAEVAAALPSSRVLKAFNTTFAGTLGSKSVGPTKTTVLVAGDDADAKAALISAIQAGGLDVVDVGALTRARELEALGFLQVTLAIGGKGALDRRIYRRTLTERHTTRRGRCHTVDRFGCVTVIITDPPEVAPSWTCGLFDKRSTRIAVSSNVSGQVIGLAPILRPLFSASTSRTH